MLDLELQARLFPEGLIVVQFDGVLDAHSADQAERMVRDLFDEGFHRIAFDLAKLRTLTSAGAGVLIGGIALAQEAGGDLALVRPTAHVRQILDLLGLTTVFHISDDTDRALGYLRRLAPRRSWPMTRSTGPGA